MISLSDVNKATLLLRDVVNGAKVTPEQIQAAEAILRLRAYDEHLHRMEDKVIRK